MGQGGGLGGLRASAQRSGPRPEADARARESTRWDLASSPDPDEWLGEVAFPEPSGWDPIADLGSEEGLEPEAPLEEVLEDEPQEEPAEAGLSRADDASLGWGRAELEGAGFGSTDYDAADFDDARALEAEELRFDAEEWRAASERYLAAQDCAETARLDRRPTRALPRVESERRESAESRAQATGPTRRIPLRARPPSASRRARAARSATARLAALGPVPAAHPSTDSARRPRWGEVVRRPSFNVSQGRMARAWALAISWPRLGASEAPRRLGGGIPLEISVLATLCFGLGLALGAALLLGGEQGQPEVAARKGSTASAIQVAGAPVEAPIEAPGRGAVAAPPSASRALAAGARGRSELRAGSSARRVELARSAAGAALQPAPRALVGPGAGARALRQGERAEARLLESEELLGAAGGVRLGFGLACGELGGQAHVPLILERGEDAPQSARLACELRHDPRLRVIAVHAGPAAREAGAALSFEVLGQGRLALRLEGGRPLGAGELCVVELSVPLSGLPSYLPLEAVSLSLAAAAGAPLEPRLGAGACGALLLE